MTEKNSPNAIIVTGSLQWTDGALIDGRLSLYEPGTILIHGNAKGADTLAGRLCVGRRLVEVRVPYIPWLGRSGGPARNGYMLKLLLGLCEVGYVVGVEAFNDDLQASKGTWDMMSQAKKKDIWVKWNRHVGAKNRTGRITG